MAMVPQAAVEQVPSKPVEARMDTGTKLYANMPVSNAPLDQAARDLAEMRERQLLLPWTESSAGREVAINEEVKTKYPSIAAYQKALGEKLGHDELLYLIREYQAGNPSSRERLRTSASSPELPMGPKSLALAQQEEVTKTLQRLSSFIGERTFMLDELRKTAGQVVGLSSYLGSKNVQNLISLQEGQQAYFASIEKELKAALAVSQAALARGDYTTANLLMSAVEKRLGGNQNLAGFQTWLAEAKDKLSDVTNEATRLMRIGQFGDAAGYVAVAIASLPVLAAAGRIALPFLQGLVPSSMTPALQAAGGAQVVGEAGALTADKAVALAALLGGALSMAADYRKGWESDLTRVQEQRRTLESQGTLSRQDRAILNGLRQEETRLAGLLTQPSASSPWAIVAKLGTGVVIVGLALWGAFNLGQEAWQGLVGPKLRREVAKNEAGIGRDVTEASRLMLDNGISISGPDADGKISPDTDSRGIVTNFDPTVPDATGRNDLVPKPDSRWSIQAHLNRATYLTEQERRFTEQAKQYESITAGDRNQAERAKIIAETWLRNAETVLTQNKQRTEIALAQKEEAIAYKERLSAEIQRRIIGNPQMLAGLEKMGNCLGAALNRAASQFAVGYDAWKQDRTSVGRTAGGIFDTILSSCAAGIRQG